MGTWLNNKREQRQHYLDMYLDTGISYWFLRFLQIDRAFGYALREEFDISAIQIDGIPW